MRGKVLSSRKSKRNSEDSGRFYENGKLKKQCSSMLWHIVKVLSERRTAGENQKPLRRQSASSKRLTHSITREIRMTYAELQKVGSS
jgi:hypothetical protein